jgi:hypothetical protein
MKINNPLKDHLMENIWKPLLVHTSFQLIWLVIQIRYEVSFWIFLTVMIIASALLLSWPNFEKKRFKKVIRNVL